MTSEQYIKAQLAEFAWREGSRYGGSDILLALAFVIRNRVRAGWFGGEWLQVIEHAHDSSALEACACASQCARCNSSKQPDLRNDDVKIFLRQVDDIYSGLATDKFTIEPSTGAGALYFCELRCITREWFLKNIIRNPTEHPKIADVAQIAFFK